MMRADGMDSARAAVTLIEGIGSLIAAAMDDRASLAALAEQVKQSAVGMQAAIEANTARLCRATGLLCFTRSETRRSRTVKVWFCRQCGTWHLRTEEAR